MVALPLPRHGESAAADLAASHTGLDGAVLLIEGARTRAHGITTGAVAVFRAFQRAQPLADRSRRAARDAPAAAQINLPLVTLLVYIFSSVTSDPGVRGLGKSARQGVLGAAPAEAGPRNSTGVTPAGLLLQEHACAARLQAGSSGYWGGQRSA
eukprot:COSAG03_NODE_14_length_22296_cov_10.813128_11_plen_154_part_00